ncbi:MAG: DUF177 domain-containing protein [Lachnospiraceae bacterium]|nr:DUF177 domain-containing protein [Lachnospiraceae bacterium]
MFIDLSNVFQNASSDIHQQYTAELTQASYRGQEFAVLEKSPFTIDCVYEQDGRAGIRADGCIVLDMYCDRCLKPVPEKLDIHVERTVYAPDCVPADEAEDNLEIMDGYQLNMERLIFNEILMNWPAKILCRPDCRGLCKVCGKDLNLGDCGCDDFVPDPRMAVIKDIINADKEV